MVNPEDLKQAVLKSLPYRKDPILGTVDSCTSIHGIKDYFNPRRDDIILGASDDEIKAAIRKLLKEGLIEFRGNKSRTATYSRTGQNPAYICPICGRMVEYNDIMGQEGQVFTHEACRS